MRYSSQEKDEVNEKIRDAIVATNGSKPFERQFSDVPEVFYKKETGNRTFAWNVHGATTNTTAGTTSNLGDSYQARGKTPSSSGIPTSQTNGVTLTIRYQSANGEANAKIFKVTEDEASDFLTELNEGAPFPALTSKEQTVVFPADKIYEIRIEEEDVPEVSESKGQKTTKLGGGKAA